MHSVNKYTTHIFNKTKLAGDMLIVINNYSRVKYTLVDASSRFLILEDDDGSLIAVSPFDFFYDFHLQGFEGDLDL